jgi:hypothetical protein
VAHLQLSHKKYLSIKPCQHENSHVCVPRSRIWIDNEDIRYKLAWFTCLKMLYRPSIREATRRRKTKKKKHIHTNAFQQTDSFKRSAREKKLIYYFEFLAKDNGSMKYTRRMDCGPHTQGEEGIHDKPAQVSLGLS